MEKPKQVKPASLLSLLETQLPEKQYWIDPILPMGGTLLFGGEAKVGKSFVLLELARSLSTGSLPFGCDLFKKAEPCKVLLIEQEVGIYGLQKRAKEIFQNEKPEIFGDKLFYASKVPELMLDSKEGREIVFDLVDAVKPNVLILDPIGRMHAYDENSSNQIEQLFKALGDLEADFRSEDMSIVVSHHFLKPSNDPNSTRDYLDAYNFRGSSKFKDDPDTLITMAKLKYLATPHKAWNIKMRFDTRQDEGLPDFLLSFNREDDMRVRFEKVFEDKPQPIKKLGGGNDTKTTGGKQLRFAEA